MGRKEMSSGYFSCISSLEAGRVGSSMGSSVFLESQDLIFRNTNSYVYLKKKKKNVG